MRGGDAYDGRRECSRLTKGVPGNIKTLKKRTLFAVKLRVGVMEGSLGGGMEGRRRWGGVAEAGRRCGEWKRHGGDEEAGW
eukprot:1757275-Rhodomonas_salina.1